MDLQSQEVNEIVKALCKAQGAMGNAVKNSTNPHFKSKFADLFAVLDACKDELAENDLYLAQQVTTIDTKTMLVTTIYHTSGQWIRSYLPLFLEKQTSQGQGSAITYARRYALTSLLGIAQADDDGQAAEIVHEPIGERTADTLIRRIKEWPEQLQKICGNEIKKVCGKNKINEIPKNRLEDVMDRIAALEEEWEREERDQVSA